MDREILLHYYLDKDYNCAEALLRTANDEFDLELSEDALGLLGAFGGGMGCGDTCGALASAMAVISRVFIEGRAHKTAGFSEVCQGFRDRFQEKLRGTKCADLKEQNFAEGSRCLKTVEDTYILLEQYLTEKGKLKG